jgi:hypothetical protein
MKTLYRLFLFCKTSCTCSSHNRQDQSSPISQWLSPPIPFTCWRETELDRKQERLTRDCSCPPFVTKLNICMPRVSLRLSGPLPMLNWLRTRHSGASLASWYRRRTSNRSLCQTRDGQQRFSKLTLAVSTSSRVS